MGDRYVLSVWKNHGDVSKWLFDICDERSYLRRKENENEASVAFC